MTPLQNSPILFAANNFLFCTVENENELTPVRGWARAREIGWLLKAQWPKYVVDVLVIIISITISFTFDNYKDESNRRTSEQAYLKALLGDINSDINELNEVIAQTDSVVKKANWLLALSEKPGAVKMEEFGAAIRQVIGRPNFISKDATFSDLTSSGNLLLLEDMDLKARLFEYYRLYESVRAVETAERETVNINIAPYLMKNISIKGLRRGARGPAVHEGVHVDQLVKQDDFNNVISLRLLTRQELLEGYREELGVAQKIKDGLVVKINH
jgi:hypothetical protein